MSRILKELERRLAEITSEPLSIQQATERLQERLCLAFPDLEQPSQALVRGWVIEDQRSARKSGFVEAYQDAIAVVKRTDDAIQPFLYQLLRDHLPAGAVEKLVSDACQYLDKNTHYSNGYLGAYAAELRNRLLGDKL